MNKILVSLIFLLGAGFGALLADGQETAEVPAANRPWSGYWWPYQQGGMVTGAALKRTTPVPEYYADWEGFFSPLEKYSLAFGEDPRGDAWAWEDENHHQPDAPSWYGHCNGWASAAIQEPEPVTALELNGIYFRVGDQKALLTELHQQDPAVVYDPDSAGDDGKTMSPVLFHTVLVDYIKTRGQAIVVENDPGEQIWNFPCYKYDMTWTDAGTTRNFTTTYYLLQDFVSPDSTNPSISRLTVHYNLYLDEEGAIIGGAWTDDSVTNHPDFMWEPIGQNSANPYLDPSRVDQIMASVLTEPPTDDPFESNDTRETATLWYAEAGFFRSFNEDWYRLPVEAGETVDVSVYPAKLDVVLESALTDAAGQAVGVREDTQDRVIFHAGKQPVSRDLYIQVRAAEPQTNHRNYGVQVERASRSFFMPHVANLDPWTTEAFLLNRTATTGEVDFNFYRTLEDQVEGESYRLAMAPGEVRYGLLDDIVPELTPDYNRWLRFRTDDRVSGVFFFSNDAFVDDLASMPILETGSRTLQMNHVAVDATWWTGVSVANTDPHWPAKVTLLPYRPNGTLAGAALEVEIAGGGRYIRFLSDVFAPEVLSETGWVGIESDREVVGFELFATNDGRLFEGIPLQEGGQSELIAPWVPERPDWWTGIAVVNPDRVSATIRITPFKYSGTNAYSPTLHYFEKTLAPKEKFVILVDQLFPDAPSTITFLKVETTSASRSVNGFVLYGNFLTNVLCGYPLIGRDELRTSGLLPYKDGAVLIINNVFGSNSPNATGQALDAQGALLGTGSAYAARATRRYSLAEVFGGAVPAGTAYLKWTSPKTIFVLQEVLGDGRGTVVGSVDCALEE